MFSKKAKKPVFEFTTDKVIELCRTHFDPELIKDNWVAQTLLNNITEFKIADDHYHRVLVLLPTLVLKGFLETKNRSQDKTVIDYILSREFEEYVTSKNIKIISIEKKQAFKNKVHPEEKKPNPVIIHVMPKKGR